MIRRNPTRIELKIDDLHEYETHKKELDDKKGNEDTGSASGPESSVPLKTRVEIIQQRIGYKPDMQAAK